MELLILLGRLLTSSYSNVVQKQLAHAGFHPFYIVLSAYALISLLALPFLLFIPIHTLSAEFWFNMSLAALFDMTAGLFMVLAVARTDLSVFGPLNAYKVVFSTLLALVFLHEIPSMQGFIGIAIIILGSFLLFPPSKGVPLHHLFRDRGVQYRFLSILLFSIGTLPLKNAVILSTPLTTTLFWGLLGLPLAMLANRLFVHDNIAQDFKRSRAYASHFVGLGVLIFVLQYCTLILFSQMLIAYSLALFQLAMVLQVFFGHKIFNEPHFYRRLFASLVMVAGSLLVLTTK
jgi:drug/metabolite transporter (DMT)-like permease